MMFICDGPFDNKYILFFAMCVSYEGWLALDGWMRDDDEIGR